MHVIVEYSMSFKVQKQRCQTWIYKKGSSLNPKILEAEIMDSYGEFTTFRVCHHSKDACCHGFWTRHKDHFNLGHIAQRLNMVKFVDDDRHADL